MAALRGRYNEERKSRHLTHIRPRVRTWSLFAPESVCPISM